MNLSADSSPVCRNTLRIMVESRLPDLVRSIINEELEKLKEELGKGLPFQ